MKKTNFIAFILSGCFQNYLYCAYYQLPFATIDHFPRLCSITFLKKTALMHHAAIINILCLKHSEIILYFKH